MRVTDSHFHWFPRSFFDELSAKKTFPRTEPDGKGGYKYLLHPASTGSFMDVWAEWFDLERQLEHMDTLRHDVRVVGSCGPFAVHFSDLPVDEGRDAATQWNEEMAGAQRSHPGRFTAMAAVPLVDTATAIDVVTYAVRTLDLRGVSLPSSVGSNPNIDAPALEPFYACVEELGVPLFLHPTDRVFADILAEGYGGALYSGLGRVTEVSVAAMRLILSGIMERHPKLKVIISHSGGALPYQAGRMDKNSSGVKLQEKPSVYLKRMYTETVSPHMEGIRFAVEFFGSSRVLYGSDYPCWNPTDALRLFNEIGLSSADSQRILNDNAEQMFDLNSSALLVSK